MSMRQEGKDGHKAERSGTERAYRGGDAVRPGEGLAGQARQRARRGDGGSRCEMERSKAGRRDGAKAKGGSGGARVRGVRGGCGAAQGGTERNRTRARREPTRQDGGRLGRIRISGQKHHGLRNNVPTGSKAAGADLGKRRLRRSETPKNRVNRGVFGQKLETRRTWASKRKGPGVNRGPRTAAHETGADGHASRYAATNAFSRLPAWG